VRRDRILAALVFAGGTIGFITGVLDLTQALLILLLAAVMAK